MTRYDWLSAQKGREGMVFPRRGWKIVRRLQGKKRLKGDWSKTRNSLKKVNFTKVQDVLQGIQSLLADLMKTCKLKIPPFRNLIIYQRGCNRIELFRTLSLLQRNVFFILFKDIRLKKKMNEFQNIFLFNILNNQKLFV